jgi:hypothetical protein
MWENSDIDLEQPFEDWVNADGSKDGRARRINGLIICGLAFFALGILLCYLWVAFAMSYQGTVTGDGGNIPKAGLLFLIPFFIGGFLLYLARKFRLSISQTEV